MLIGRFVELDESSVFHKASHSNGIHQRVTIARWLFLKQNILHPLFGESVLFTDEAAWRIE